MYAEKMRKRRSVLELSGEKDEESDAVLTGGVAYVVFMQAMDAVPGGFRTVKCVMCVCVCNVGAGVWGPGVSQIHTKDKLLNTVNVHTVIGIVFWNFRQMLCKLYIVRNRTCVADDVNFLAQFLPVCQLFDFTQEQEDKICDR